MMTRHTSRRRPGLVRAGVRALAAASLTAVAACSGLGDVLAPGEPGALPARFALDVVVPRFQTSSFERVELRVQPSYESSTGFRPLGDPFTVVLLNTAEQPVALPIDLGPCLADDVRVRPENLDDRCNVRLALTLIGDGRTLDQSEAGPFTLAPGGITRSSTPVVLREVGSVDVTGPLGSGPLDLIAGANAQLTAVARDAGNNALAGRAFTWTTSNAAVASVSATGLVTALAPGSATITATTGDRSGTVNVVVRPPFETLSVEAATGIVNGTVTVTSSPAGINCNITPLDTGGACSAEFVRGTLVTLTATVGAETIFERWLTNGGCAPSDLTPVCEVTVPEGGRSVVVTSDQLRTFRIRPTSSNLSLSGLPAVGRVTDLDGFLPGGCDLNGLSFGGTCDAQVPSRRDLRLVATPTDPSSGADFPDLNDVCDQQTIGLGLDPATCIISPPHASPPDVPVFLRGPERLSVAGSGSGSGLVTAPGLTDIACAYDGEVSTGTCTSDYREGSLVTLTAAPSPGSQFLGWRVDGSLTLTPGLSLQLTLNGPRSAVAVFEQNLVPLTIRILPGDGAGTITVNNSPACSVSMPLESNTCVIEYAPGTQVVLRAVAENGSIHELWGGACAGIIPELETFPNLCGGPMDEPITVDATFARRADLSFGIVDSNFDFLPATATVQITSPGRRTYTCTKNPVGGDVLFCGTVPMPVGAQITFSVQITGANEFLGYSGSLVPGICTDGNPNPCVFTMPLAGAEIDAVIARFD
jgi:hypothetical protein